MSCKEVKGQAKWLFRNCHALYDCWNQPCLDKQVDNVERSQTNIVLAWEGTAKGFAVRHLERISHSAVQPFQSSMIKDSAGEQRQVDVAAFTRDMSILLESKSMANIDAVDQIVSLREFVR